MLFAEFQQNGLQDLHSSMERLKVGEVEHRSSVWVKFTFQYGEIKSIDFLFLLRYTIRFTFQYGEIKSR